MDRAHALRSAVTTSSTSRAFSSWFPRPGRLTIEVGCGEGRVARELLALGHRVLGFDASPALARAAASHRVGASRRRRRYRRLPIATAAADVVVCFMVLMDIEDLDGAVAELARVLAPGGTLCVGIMHPIMTSGLFVPGDEYGTFYMGEYLKTMRHVLDIERRDGGIFRFRLEHRPIEQYFRAFEAAGLAVTALREPRPSEELAAEQPGVRERAYGFRHFCICSPVTSPERGAGASRSGRETRRASRGRPRRATRRRETRP